MTLRDRLIERWFDGPYVGDDDIPPDQDDPLADKINASGETEDESPQAAWERIGLEEAWAHDYPDVRGFAG